MTQVDQKWPLGSQVPSHFDAGIVAASFFASLCGCFLTVELLHRRVTALGNLRSWLETLGCATAMGLVGIWSMHFIGNRAIILGDGNSSIQLVYNPGFTTLSVFLPIIGLTIAFSAAEIATRSAFLHWVLLLCTGVFAGLSIVGMHYIGNFGIMNYRLHYAARDLAASMVIAIGDCILVLMLFYTWREKWISAWWKRLACALLLAGGVTAMHFTASTNCVYTLTEYSDESDIHARNTQVLVAGVLCGAAAAISLAVLLIIKHRFGVLKTRSQKVMLACVVFDPDGRIMVTTDGVLPAREITDKYRHQTFGEDFDTAHPVFQWIFRVSHHWSSVSELVPHMRHHLNAIAEREDGESRPASSRSSYSYEPQAHYNYSTIFRERFCIAAASLAASMHVSLEEAGTLYNKIIDTGTLAPDEKVNHPLTDLEENPMAPRPFGKGQLLFLVQKLGRDDVDKLLNAGFRFASISHVGRNVAEPMQIPLSTLELHISQIKRYVEKPRSTVTPGTWLGCFAMIPKPGHKGFDVVVQDDEQDRLPEVPLLPSEPFPWQIDFLQRMEGMKTSACIGFLQNNGISLDPVRTTSEHQFAMMIADAIHQLSQQIPSGWFQEARFCAQPLRVRCSAQTGTDLPTRTLFAFCVIADVHTTHSEYSRITRIPLNFFSTMQRCAQGTSDHRALERDIKQELAPILSRRTMTNSPRSPTDRWRKHIPSLHTIGSSSRAESREKKEQDTVEDDTTKSQTTSAVPTPVSSFEKGHAHQSWAGSLVQDDTIGKANIPPPSTPTLPQAGLETASEITNGITVDEETFVDSLVATTRARFFNSRAIR